MLLAFLAALGLLAGCGSSCDDLSERICRCEPPGERQRCERAVKELADGADFGVCNRKLDSCHAPAGVELCDWITTPAGKVACGLASE